MTHAAHIDVRLAASDGEITIEVRDDGDGFDTGGDFPGHIGLSSMRERAMNAAGTLDITSTPGDGTRVFGRIVLRPSAAP